jgi:hypothetical protein
MAWNRPLEYSLWMKIVNMHMNKSLLAWKRPLEYSLWMKIVNMQLNKSLLAWKRPLEYSLWMKIVNMHLNKMRLRDKAGGREESLTSPIILLVAEMIILRP